MLDLKPLRQFGLKYTDIRLYKSVLALGKAKSGTLIKESGLVSSSFYISISLLIEKGLVSYEVKNNVRYYKPESMEALIEQSKGLTGTLVKISTELEKQKSYTHERNNVDILEGYHGLERAFLDHVAQFNSTSHIRIIGFGSTIPKRKALNNFLEKINHVAGKKMCKMTILLDQKFLDNNNINPVQELKKIKIHYLPTTYFGPTAYNIIDNEVLLSVWGERPTVVRFRHPTIVRNFIANFDFLLKHAIKLDDPS